MRRFLRDPDGDIWDSEEIRLYWNNAQLEIATKINYIERVHAYRYPPFWTWTYLYDHEYSHCEGDRYKAFHGFGARDMVVTYPWEPGYTLDALDYADDGTRFTHPWESEYCSPADVIKIPLHAQFHRMKFSAFDEQKIDPITEKEVAEGNRFYKTTEGEPVNYYRISEEENTVVIYPKPSSVTWDDAYLLGSDPDESFSETSGEGLINYQADSYDEADYGVIFDTIDADGHLLMIFEVLPDDVEEETDTWGDPIAWWPAYMLPVIEYATLERCFGADTEGYIPSLRDYWELRKKIGIETIKQFKQDHLKDRDFRMGGEGKVSERVYPSLPSGYPACP